MTIDHIDLSIMEMIYSGNPSIHEIREVHRWRSTGSVHHRLKRLQDLGYVNQPSFRQARSRELTERGKEVLKGAGLINETVQVQRGVRRY